MDTMEISMGYIYRMGDPLETFESYSGFLKRLSRDYRWPDRPLLRGMESGELSMATTSHRQPPPATKP